jgi:hypothetical protein
LLAHGQIYAKAEKKSKKYLVPVVSFQTSLDHIDMGPFTADVVPFLVANKNAAEKTNQVGAFQQLEVDAHRCVELPNFGRQVDLPAFVLLGYRLCLCSL